MRVWRDLIGLLVVVSAQAVDTSSAQACVPPPATITDRTVFPEDGALDVPINTRVFIEYAEDDPFYGDPGHAVELRVQGGAPVAASTVTPRTSGFARILVPDAPLAPSTTYEVTDTLAVPCQTPQTGACVGEPVVIARFTTGTELDTTPPSVGSVRVEHTGWCGSPACPDGRRQVVELVFVEDVIDDQPASRIHFEYLAPDGALVAGPTRATVLGRSCGAGSVPFYLLLETPPRVELRAVDLAGNVEGVSHPIDGETCQALDCGAPDAGPGDAGDAVDGDGSDAGGCGCVGARGEPGIAAIGLGLLALVVARRRGRPRSTTGTTHHHR